MNERMDLADRLREVIDTAIGDGFSVTHERAVGADPAGDADRAEAEAVRDEVLAALLRSGDEHHTLDELYEYRMLYNALAANEWAAHGTYPVVKSWRHSDGEECFGGGWFIVVATLPTGQVSNHYAAEHWDLFAVPEVETPPEYDGHDPAEAARRMRALLSQPTPSAECARCAHGLDVHSEHGGMGEGCQLCLCHAFQHFPTATPPRIDDMAPGTTWDQHIRASRPVDIVDRDFEAWEEAEAARRSAEPEPGMQVEDRHGRVGTVVRVRKYVNSATVDFGGNRHSVVRLDGLIVVTDPSTIRDVTPPPAKGGAQ